MKRFRVFVRHFTAVAPVGPAMPTADVLRAWGKLSYQGEPSALSAPPSSPGQRRGARRYRI
ncbi:hypothetical protein ABLN73_09445 [Mycobacterium tuberculosis]